MGLNVSVPISHSLVSVIDLRRVWKRYEGYTGPRSAPQQRCHTLAAATFRPLPPSAFMEAIGRAPHFNLSYNHVCSIVSHTSQAEQQYLPHNSVLLWPATSGKVCSSPIPAFCVIALQKYASTTDHGTCLTLL